jgi:hypothetical protein
MLCDSFSKLTPFEKIKFIGELVHACQVSEKFFKNGQDIITLAKKEGTFDGVTILPTSKIEDYETTEHN